MMKKLPFLVLIASLFISLNSFGQFAHLSILTQNDTTVCGPLTLRATAVVTPAIVVNPVDDDYAPGTSPIGFSFNFYGNTYTRCLVSSNGYISFNLQDSGQYSAWSLTAAGGLPGNTSCVNSICGIYNDIYLVTGGTIKTYTVGNAPNRKFVVNFCDCPMYYPTNCTNHETFQIILYETTNIIEVHITNYTSCSVWNGGLAIQGVQNAAGTAGTPTPGRNNSVWSAYSDANRWTPVGTTSYTVATIPFAPIPDSTVGQYNWYSGSTFLGNGTTVGNINSINVTPVGPTTYTCKFPAFNCGTNDTAVSSINVLASILHIKDIVFQPTTCGACNGKIEIIGLKPSSTDTIYSMKNGTWQPGIVAIPGADSTVFLTNLCAATYDSIYAKSLCPSDTLSPVVLINPPIKASYTDTIKYGCSGDTVMFRNFSSAQGATIIKYLWTYGDGTTDTAKNPSHIFAGQGTYAVKLQISNTTCIDTMTQSIPLLHPLKASFTNNDSVCKNQPLSFNNTSTTTTLFGIQPTYFWDFGNGDTSMAVNPVYTYHESDSGLYKVSLGVQDFVPCVDFVTKTIDVLWTPYHYFDHPLFCSYSPQFIGLELVNSTYSWLTPQDSVFKGNCCIIPRVSGIYYMNTSNYCGTDVDTVNVSILDCDKCLFVPNAFTPNGDGRNDYFHVRQLCPIRHYGIRIFNRFGQLVYDNYYISEGWDGKVNGTPADLGTYLYEITYTPDLPGAHETFLKGDITLIR